MIEALCKDDENPTHTSQAFPNHLKCTNERRLCLMHQGEWAMKVQTNNNIC